MTKSNEEIINEMQQVVQQMVIDDLEENPDIANDFFDCDCCGKNKNLAGSIQYGDYRLCNDCVLLAETGFALGKIKDIQDLMDAMEDKRLEELCKFIKEEEVRKTQMEN
ncbi:MAG TPA: hypothetical protein DCS44_08850 [Cyanobacteria bacterium UBA10660]|nr:MAG TPA: hypothetical protein CPT83_03605 [Candidatus Gastranaerophilales bacterium HUM_1]HAS94703.1 hypothetical protein [Cyanobacteria bacterium UBA10660]